MRIINDRSDFFNVSFFCLYLFLIQFTLRTPLYDARGVDFQVLARVLIMLSTFSIFIRYLPSVISDIRYRVEKIFWVYIGYLLILSFFTGFYSFYSVMTLLITAYILRTFIYNYGLLAFVKFFVYVSFIFFSLSLLFYYGAHEIGRYSYWTLEYFFTSTRMQGVAGHPNTLALMAGTTLLLISHFNQLFNRRFVLIFVILIAFSLFLTNSKTNIFAFFLCYFLYLLSHKKYFVSMQIALLFFISGLIIIFGFNFHIEILKLLSRTGDVSEITSFTGRTDIWDFVLQLVAERPLFGWGYGSASDLLVTRSENVGFVVAQTHNLYLQILFTTGAVGFFIFSWLIIDYFRSLRNCAFSVFPYIVIYLLIVGVSEAVIFNTIASMSFLLFSVSIFSSCVYRVENFSSSS